jgi:hypothetical protein
MIMPDRHRAITALRQSCMKMRVNATSNAPESRVGPPRSDLMKRD